MQQGSNQPPPSSPTPMQGPLPAGGATGFIQADPTTNTLIITANERVYRNLRVGFLLTACKLNYLIFAE